jgi:hypothetical protein
MCECIDKLIEKGFVRSDHVIYDEKKKDFIETDPIYRIHHINKKGYWLRVRYCPTCGTKLVKE